MTKLDQRIEEALEAEDRAMMEQLGEQGILRQFGGLFQGKMAWITVVTVAAGLVLSIIGLYAAWKFATADDTNTMLRWAGIAWFGLSAQMLIKLWSWMRMETNRILREVKRLELQMARLLEKMPSSAQ
ncbi:MAG: hypothetical protein COB78_10480 [Hyphomicrobiales bacterium]|nr:MAG: hypothetical protein COB78_10480 [Hyphomicrobiales bacterium]